MENTKFHILAFSLFLSLLWSCKTKTGVENLSVNSVSMINFSASDSVLIDVRTAQEFLEGHLPSALNIDVNSADFDKEVDQLDKTKTYYIYCRSGNRSQKAIDLFQEKGFLHLKHLKDGYKNYNNRK